MPIRARWIFLPPGHPFEVMNLKLKLAIGSTVLAAAALGGGAYAATQGPAAGTRQAFLGDVAKRLNVSPAQLGAALQGAFDDQLQAAVAAGKLTQAEANAIKQRMQSYGGVPGPGFWLGHRPAGAPGMGSGDGPLAAAAKYLGLSQKQLFDDVTSGQSLAQVAKAHGKSVSGLTAAMTAAARARLDKAVADHAITSAQEQQSLSRLSVRLDREINATGQGNLGRGRFRGWDRHGPPPMRFGATGPVPAVPAGPVD